MLRKHISEHKLIFLLLAASCMLQWPAEAEPPFEIINISAHIDKDEYNRTEIIKINYSLYCIGNNANLRNMHFKLNNSFDFSRPLIASVHIPLECEHAQNDYDFLDQDKTLAVELFDDNKWRDAKLTTILCNITSNTNCSVGIYDLTHQSFVKLNDSSHRYQRIPKRITIKDNPPTISNFTGNTHIAEQGEILKFNFFLSDKDSENISWALYLNDSIIGEMTNISQNETSYNSSIISPGFYIFRLFAKSAEGGSAWSSSWEVDIISPPINLYPYVFSAILSIIFLIFYFFTPNISIIFSSIISIFILAFQYAFFEAKFLIVSSVALLTTICMCFLISAYLLEREQDSTLGSARILSHLRSNPQKYRILKFMSLMVSSSWMAIVIMILVFFSSDVCGQDNIIFSNYLGILLFSFAPEVLFRFTKCRSLYILFLAIICLAFIRILVEFSGSFYVSTPANSQHAMDIAFMSFFSLIILPIHIYIYLIYVERVKPPPNH